MKPINSRRRRMTIRFPNLPFGLFSVHSVLCMGCSTNSRTQSCPSALLRVLKGSFLQQLCDGPQNFARKILIRYGARKRERPDQRAISQNRFRSCRPLISGWNQTGQQLDVAFDFPGGEGTSLLIAACDLPRERADGASRAWIVAVPFVQIFVDQLF